MELPSNPKNLVYGAYNKKGVNIANEFQDVDKLTAIHALSDVQEQSRETAYDMLDYNFNF